MTLIRVFSIAFFAGLAIYTAVVIINHGANLLPVFLGDLFSVSWSGQFNLDFAGYLTLSALWIAWRHRFSTAGIAMGLLAFLAGMLFFAPYLFFAIGKANGNFNALFLGDRSIASANGGRQKTVGQ